MEEGGEASSVEVVMLQVIRAGGMGRRRWEDGDGCRGDYMEEEGG